MLILRPSIEIAVTRLAAIPRGYAEPLVATPGTDMVALAAAVASAEATSYEGEVDGWRRRCGIPRPSSAARSCVAAALACRALVERLTVDPARLGVATASTTSATATAARFETRGVVEGWGAVDPLLLPSTLLSAIATQVAAAAGAKAFATAFETGLLGFFHAVEAAIHGLVRRDADAVLVVVADERTDVQRTAQRRIGGARLPPEQVGSLALERGAGAGRRLAFLAYGEPLDDGVLAGWEHAPRHEITSAPPEPVLQSGAVLTAVMAALASDAPRVLVRGTVPGLGSASLGFEAT